MGLGGRDVLKLVVDADSSGASREFDKLGRGIKGSLGDVEKQASGLSGTLGRAFDSIAAKSPMAANALNKLGLSGAQAGAALASTIPFAAAAAGAAIGAFAIGGIQKASALNEQISKTQAVFGGSADAILKWSQSSATSFGQTQTQALEAASSFGNMFLQLGLGADVATSMSTKLTELASDFASFFNTDPASAIDAISSAFRGEYDAVQKFVPTITAAAVEHKALEMGLKATTKELTAQDKALAAYELIMTGAGKAAGDFDRTSGSLANQSRTLSANIEALQISLGQALVPALTDAARVANLFLSAINSLAGPLGGLSGLMKAAFSNIPGPQHLAGVFEPGASAVDRFGAAVSVASPFLGGLISRIDGTNSSMAITRNVFAEATGAVSTFVASFSTVGESAEAAAQRVTDAFALMQGNLNADEAILNLQDSFARVGEAAVASLGGGATEARNTAQAVIDLKQQVVAYGDQILGLPPERVTELLAQIDSGDLAGAEAALNKAAEERKAKMTAVPSSQAAVADFNAAVAARIAQMTGVANTGAAEGNLNNTARSRQASIVANANSGAAEGNLNNTSRSRAASINAQANTGSAEAALNNTARSRTSTVTQILRTVVSGAVGMIPGFAGGVRNYGGGLAMVGEGGPELISLPKGSDVYSSSDTRAMQAGGPSALPPMSGGGSRGGNTYIFRVEGILDPVSSGRAVKQAIAAAERAGVN